MKILYAEWMKELDARAIHEIGIPSIVLMENASQATARVIARTFPQPEYKNALIIVGKGNNGGDGIACGRILWQKGYGVEFILLSAPNQLNPDPKTNFQIIKNLNLTFRILKTDNDLRKRLEQYNPQDTFIIDSIFGTGINQPINDDFYSPLIRLVNESGFKTVSIDVPSGLSENFLPDQSDHIRAAHTVTFLCPKISHFYPDGNKYCGNLEIVDIGIPRSLLENEKYYIQLIQPEDFKTLLKTREIDSHKGHYGHCLNISGSLEKPGAGILSSYAILRAGAGLCTIATDEQNRTLAVQAHPEIMTLLYKKLDDIIKRLDEFNCILMGPGLGNTKQTYDMTTRFIQYAKVPIILDADSINIFQMGKDFLKVKRDFPIILTPHPGEFSRLTGISIKEIQKNRIRLSREFAADYNVVVILKGHHTVIATPQGRVFINETGNAGMASAGSGDVLAGLISGMIAQFYNHHDLDTILQAAVFLHGFAADLAARQTGEIGLTATDILNFIPRAFINLNEFKTQFPFSG
jgi:NAD(P)H-hydrate epimerase